MLRTMLCCTFLITSVASAAPPAIAEKQVDPEIQKLIEKATEVSEEAVKSLPKARGSGTHKVTIRNKDGSLHHEERSKFGMAFDGAKEFIQFHYEPGAGHEDADVYARVVFAENRHIHEARFCQRISMGAEVKTTENYGEGLQPVVWMPGKVIDYYSRIRVVLEEGNFILSLREEKGLKILTASDPWKRVLHEFWIDPAKAYHLVRFRSSHKNGELDVTRQWKQTKNLWYVERCHYHDRSNDNAEFHTDEEIELTFDSFEPMETIPPEVFSFHALGLPKGAYIHPMDSRDPDEERTRYEPDPKFDRAKVEAVVGKLPKVKPRR